MTRDDVRTPHDLEHLLAAATGGTAGLVEMGPLDLWNAHDDGSGPGWTAQVRLVLPPGTSPQDAIEALERLGFKLWSTEVQASRNPAASRTLRLVAALRACDWHGLLAETGAALSAHLRHEIAAGGHRHRQRMP